MNKVNLTNILNNKTYIQMSGEDFDKKIEALSTEPSIIRLLKLAYVNGYTACQSDLLEVLKNEVKNS